MRIASFAAVPALALAALVAAGPVAAQSVSDTIAARQGQFKLLALHVGPLVAMAQGNMEYDAAVAQAAADNLVRIAGLDQGLLWPAGSDNAAAEGTRALPAIWDDLDDFTAKLVALREASANMQAAAGQDLDALRGALGPVGGACSACHEAYRAPQ